MAPTLAPFRRDRRAARLNCLWLLFAASFGTGAGCKPPTATDAQRTSPITVEGESPSAGPRPAPAPDRTTPPADEPSSPIRFTHVTAQSGVDMIYHGGPSSDRHMTEQNGGGVALLDYDGDGVLDLFLTNGARFDRPAGPPHSQRLYRGLGELKYRDVTREAGLEDYGLGQGAAAGDFDNDGDVDLFVAGYRRNRLWTNNGDGTFTDATSPAKLQDDRWSTSAAWADLDDDGLLDLFVVTYVEWSPDSPPCYLPTTPPTRISCPPQGRSGQEDLLFHNGGEGAFEEIARAAGVAGGTSGKGLAAAVADFNGDDRLDIYVANDTTPNALYLNQGSNKFVDDALILGAAVSRDGSAGSSMGVAVSDYDADGRFDIAVTNFLHQPTDLFQNLGEPGFRPVSLELGIDVVSRPALKFGLVFADFDQDGWSDLFIANGHIWDLESPESGYRYRMPQHLLRNERGARFRDVGNGAGDYFRRSWLGRAVATGDLDNDGDPDLVVGQLDDPPAILRNDSDRTCRTARFHIVGTTAARQALGVRVEWDVAGKTFVTHIPAGGSFQASHDTTLLLPMPGGDRLDQVRVHWGPGDVETWSDLDPRQEIWLGQGTGTSSPK